MNPSNEQQRWQHMKALLADALERPARERGQFIEPWQVERGLKLPILGELAPPP